MPEQKLTPEEHRMMQDAFVFLRDHCCPPPTDGSEATVAWWKQAAKDAGALVDTKWHNHELIMAVTIALLSYIEKKTKEAVPDE